jgi:DNA-directed RNA polymerase subunit RPC12/RpoP
MTQRVFTEWELIHNKCSRCGGKLTPKQIMSTDYLIVCEGCNRALLIKQSDDFSTDYCR